MRSSPGLDNMQVFVLVFVSQRVVFDKVIWKGKGSKEKGNKDLEGRGVK